MNELFSIVKIKEIVSKGGGDKAGVGGYFRCCNA